LQLTEEERWQTLSSLPLKQRIMKTTTSVHDVEKVFCFWKLSTFNFFF
jgi:hypothetical protein